VKKLLLWLTVLTVSLTMIVGFSLTGCKKEAVPAEEKVTEEETAQTEEGAAEEAVPVEKEGVWYYSAAIDGIDASDVGKVDEAMAREKYPDIYATYIKYRDIAEKVEEYPDAPGASRTFAFANEVASFPFCADVESDIVRHAELAGFAKDDVYIIDNQADIGLCISNADIMLVKNPEVFVEFGMDEKSNVTIAEKFDDAGIPIFAIDVPIPDHNFMGVNNTSAAKLTGEWVAEQIDKKFGGIDNVDLIIAGELPQGGEVVLARTKIVIETLVEKYGDKIMDKVVEVDTGGVADKGQEVVSSVLAAHPDAQDIVIYCHNDQSMTGAIAAFEAAGVFNRDKALFSNMGADTSSIQNIRGGKLDGSTAFFPEHYGRYIVPAVLALLEGEPIPDFMYVKNDVVTPDNINEYYPE